MTTTEDQKTPLLTEQALEALFGMQSSVPLVPEAMAGSLLVTFYPVYNASEHMKAFANRLRHVLIDCGVRVIPYAEALSDTAGKKLCEEIVVFVIGDQQDGNLVVDHVSNLRKTTVVALTDGPCPMDAQTGSQEKLNGLVQGLCWHLAQIVIYVKEASWTITTMNGAIIKCGMDTMRQDVYDTLLPKIAAPVVPPHASDFDIREETLDLQAEVHRHHVDDFRQSGPLWARTGLMLFHTSMNSLDFRSRYYKRIAGAFLDHRSGMSYGFFARQAACNLEPALPFRRAGTVAGVKELETTGVFRDDTGLFLVLTLPQGPWVVKTPEVWTLTTRSGCDKSNINPTRDLVLMGLANGKVVFQTPRGVNHGIDCKPSYDTLTILSHALGNAIIASLQMAMVGDAFFAHTIRAEGMALAHWHGYIERGILPPGYVVHGEDNPPVSCSTFQAAIYALTGKIRAFGGMTGDHAEYAGDAHIEPHHGSNITGRSLTELAHWALEHRSALMSRQINEPVPTEPAVPR
jgi:hypothetical protein